MKLWGQPMLVMGGSVVDVASSSAFASNQISNVQAGAGSLANGVHNQGVSNVRIKSERRTLPCPTKSSTTKDNMPVPTPKPGSNPDSAHQAARVTSPRHIQLEPIRTSTMVVSNTVSRSTVVVSLSRKASGEEDIEMAIVVPLSAKETKHEEA
jgi:hypothetical protein